MFHMFRSKSAMDQVNNGKTLKSSFNSCMIINGEAPSQKLNDVNTPPNGLHVHKIQERTDLCKAVECY